MTHPHLLDRNSAELKADFSRQGWEPYRSGQVVEWFFRKRASSFEDMSSLPAPIRRNLSKLYDLRKLPKPRADHSRTDRTVKFTFDAGVKEGFSCVFLPHEGYNSLCISTQAGCAFRCGFCASGLVPFERNLSPGEIIDQILWAEEMSGEKIQNVLFMGMGEPLANYENTVRAIRWMIDPKGLAMNPKRITLSTTGLAPQIKKLADEKLNVNLALSLHAPNDKLRAEIMPVSSKFSIAEVLRECKNYQSKNSGDFTIEYILLKNTNDNAKQADELDRLLQAFRFAKSAKINLIPNNPVPTLKYQAPDKSRVDAFFSLLKKKKYIVHCRKPQGQDIGAACGQLS